MTESKSTTSNGHEIDHPRDQMTLDELKLMTYEYGLVGSNPEERIESLKKMDANKVALLMTDINRRIQGSDESLVHEGTMKIGNKELIPAEQRYDLFTKVIDKVKNVSEEINPARIGDALALTTVLLHPFKDGNGRTARMLGFIFREDFDEPDAQESYDVLSTPRDIARENDGFLINGYIPYFEEGTYQSDPKDVEHYLDSVLSSDGRLYTSAYDQAPLYKSEL